VIAGLLLIMDGLWQRALACMLGFILARVFIARWIPKNHSAGKYVV